MTYQGSWGHQGVQGGLGGTRGVQATPGAKKSEKNSKIVAPNHGLKYPKCVVTQKGWYLLVSEAFGAIWVHYNSDI